MRSRQTKNNGARVFAVTVAASIAFSLGCTFTGVTPTTQAVSAAVASLDSTNSVRGDCAIGVALAGRGDCPDDTGEELLKRTVKALAKYGGGLSTLAEIESIDTGDAVAAVIKLGETAADFEFQDADKDGIALAVEVLTRVFVNRTKRRVLRDVTHSADSSIQCVAYRGAAAVSAWRREPARHLSEVEGKTLGFNALIDAKDGSIQELKNAIRLAADTIAKLEPADKSANKPNPHELADSTTGARLTRVELDVALSDRELLRTRLSGQEEELRNLERELLPLQLVAARAQNRLEELKKLDRAFRSVAVAHNHLACHSADLGTTRDRELKTEIEQAVLCRLLTPEKWPEKKLDPKFCAQVVKLADSIESKACVGFAPGEDGPPPTCTISE